MFRSSSSTYLAAFNLWFTQVFVKAMLVLDAFLIAR